jgi:hypothetical protein
MNIPDPIELMEARIERETDKIDANGYPCCKCGKRYSIDDHDWVCMSPMGDGPLMCVSCFEDENK